MDSMPHGRSLVPVLEISRPPLKPPWSTCLSAIDSNHFPQASMISGVGFSNPKCRNMNFFIAPPCLRFHSSSSAESRLPEIRTLRLTGPQHHPKPGTPCSLEGLSNTRFLPNAQGG